MSYLNQIYTFALALLMTVGVIATSAQAFERRDGEKILVSAQRQAVPTMDPSVKYNASIRTMQQAMYDALLKYEGTPPKVKPWLAEKFDVSDDGMTYTFHLVKNAKFHEGQEMFCQFMKFLS